MGGWSVGVGTAVDPKRLWNVGSATTSKDPLTDQYKVYNTAVQQQAGDYSTIMQGYKNLLQQAQTGGQYNPTTYQYQPSQDRMVAISNLGNLAQTGGYSDRDVANIRERAISPIRSIYANAQRNIDRQRSLQGGYSPNYTAATAKMTRDLSDQIGNQTTNVNAQLAQNIAGNRLQAASPYASAAGAENEFANQMGMQNANIMNQASQFNMRDLPQHTLQALQGMQGLYGTNPALVSVFGNQALNAAQLQGGLNQQGQQGNMQIIAQILRGLGG